MDQGELINIMQQAIWTMIVIAAPLMLVGLVVGLIIALIQALTQIQEMTLTFVPKILAILFAAMILVPMMMSTLISFTEFLADKIIAVG